MLQNRAVVQAEGFKAYGCSVFLAQVSAASSSPRICERLDISRLLDWSFHCLLAKFQNLAYLEAL